MTKSYYEIKFYVFNRNISFSSRFDTWREATKVLEAMKFNYSKHQGRYINEVISMYAFIIYSDYEGVEFVANLAPYEWE